MSAYCMICGKVVDGPTHDRSECLLKVKEAKEDRERRIDALLESASVRSAQGGEMGGTRWCENCGWWVVGEHGPDVCGEFKKSAGARTKGCEHTWGRTCPYCRETQLDELLMTKPAEPEKVDHPAHYGGDTPL